MRVKFWNLMNKSLLFVTHFQISKNFTKIKIENYNSCRPPINTFFYFMVKFQLSHSFLIYTVTKTGNLSIIITEQILYLYRFAQKKLTKGNLHCEMNYELNKALLRNNSYTVMNN